MRLYYVLNTFRFSVLQDNRVKSTLRRHAMSGQQNQLSADFIDEYTLDALSKEDVLILWKKSEIELESRLQEVIHLHVGG